MDLESTRLTAVRRRRRIIFNNDGNDWTNDVDGDMIPPKLGEPKTVENFLSKRTSALAGTQVDSIFYCDGVFNLYSHKSTETEPRRHTDKYLVDWAWDMSEQGNEPLNVMIGFGKRHSIEVFWSIRMNDTHDAGDEALFCQWKRDHPDYLMGKKGEDFPFGGKRWSAVDYGVREVRDKVLRIIGDVCKRYDIDGVELDFFRHPVFFRPQTTGQPVTQEHCDMMTDLLEKVRAMTTDVERRRGKPLLIAVRVPDSVGYAKAIGLDLVAWLEKNLVDLLIGSCYFHLEPWRNFAELGRRFSKPVYAGLSAGSRLIPPHKNIRIWRGEAYDALSAGVDGIYVFNVFEPSNAIFKEIGSLETLGTLDMVYTFNPGTAMGTWLKDGERFLKEQRT